MKKYFAEMIGTMVLVLMGCGSAVIAGSAAGAVGTGVGTFGVAMAFGLSVIAMVYTIGSISGCHINPAITLGMYLTGRMNGKDAAMYMLFQVLGALIGSTVLYFIATGMGVPGNIAGANSYAASTSEVSAFLAEAFFSFIFVFVVLGSTSSKAPSGFAGIAIGLTLVLIHIVCIPITGTSVNPARSIAPALFAQGIALSQLWLFIVAPFVGAACSALVWKYFENEEVSN